MNLSETLVLLIAGALVLMVLSFLYRQSRWFTFAEHVVVGGLAGQGTAIGLRNVYYQGIVPLTTGQWWYILAIIGGLLLFAKYARGQSWLVRLPTALLVGCGIGLNMRAGIETQITAQLIDTLRPLTSINNILIIIGVCTGMLYFFFSAEEKGVMMPIGKIGRYFLMVAFGSSFAYAVLGRTSLVISRVTDILSYPTYYLVPIAIAIIIYDIYTSRKNT